MGTYNPTAVDLDKIIQRLLSGSSQAARARFVGMRASHYREIVQGTRSVSSDKLLDWIRRIQKTWAGELTFTIEDGRVTFSPDVTRAPLDLAAVVDPAFRERFVRMYLEQIGELPVDIRDAVVWEGGGARRNLSEAEIDRSVAWTNFLLNMLFRWAEQGWWAFNGRPIALYSAPHAYRLRRRPGEPPRNTRDPEYLYDVVYWRKPDRGEDDLSWQDWIEHARESDGVVEGALFCAESEWGGALNHSYDDDFITTTSDDY